MSYFKTWKRIMKENNSTNAIVNNGKSLEIREFKNDPSYRSAILQKLDLSKIQIDVRLKNIDRTINEKRFIFLPDTKVEIGSYVTYDNKIFLITEFQDDNTLSPYSKAKLCNQTINWLGLREPVSCVTEDTAYNDKGEINLDYFSMVDGKVAIYVPVNDITNQIRQNMRFIFNHDKRMIFEAISIKNVTTPNIYKIVTKKVEYFEGKDDLVNNIAYNKFLLDEEEPEISPQDGYSVSSSLGTFDIRQYGSPTFTVMKDNVIDTGNWNISVDYNGVDTSHISVESKTNNSIKIRNLKGANTNKIIITFSNGEVNISQEVGLVK